MHGGGSNSSANMAAKGGHGGGNPSRGRGGRGSFGRGGGSRGQGTPSSGVICHLCGKEGHTVLHCFKRFDSSFTGPPHRSAALATTSYGIDTNWYMDFGATNHVTGELEKLAVRDKHGSHDQVHTASGSGTEIRHVGSSTLHSPHSTIHLNNIVFQKPTKVFVP